MTFSFVKAPARPTILIAASTYGSLMTRHTATQSRPHARAWIIVEPGPDEENPLVGSTGTLRVAYNDPKTGKAVWEDAGQVVGAQVTPNRWLVSLHGGGAVTIAVAPCVCGAGAVGGVGPSPEPHLRRDVRTDTGDMEWLSA